MWAHYMSGFFTKAYFEGVKNTPLIPDASNHLEILLHTFLLEKSLSHFNRELVQRPEWCVVPLRMIISVLGLKEAIPPGVRKDDIVLKQQD
jgi:maltose alpha-D-glucosyltransferase/alpha-amylase